MIENLRVRQVAPACYEVQHEETQAVFLVQRAPLRQWDGNIEWVWLAYKGDCPKVLYGASSKADLLTRLTVIEAREQLTSDNPRDKNALNN